MSVEPDRMEATGVTVERRTRPWYSKLLAICFVLFCFEIGVFLVVFPWMDVWELNSAASYASWLRDIWGNPFFRGALSGLGLVNIYISFLEIIRLVRGAAGR
jgi:hypothetical protein